MCHTRGGGSREGEKYRPKFFSWPKIVARLQEQRICPGWLNKGFILVLLLASQVFSRNVKLNSI